MKTGFKVGAGLGFALGIGVALGMDALMGAGVGVGWTDAVARDLTRVTGEPYARGSVSVAAASAAVVGALGLVGAGLGGAAGTAVAWFVRMLGD